MQYWHGYESVCLNKYFFLFPNKKKKKKNKFGHKMLTEQIDYELSFGLGCFFQFRWSFASVGRVSNQIFRTIILIPLILVS